MAAHHQVGPSVDALTAQGGLMVHRHFRPLHAPVDEHHQVVTEGAGLLDGLHQKSRVVGGEHAGGGGARRPGGHGDDPGGPDKAHPDTVHVHDGRLPGRLRIGSGPHVENAGLIQGAHGVQEGVGAEIQGVVVGQGDQIHADLVHEGDAAFRQPEGVLLIRRLLSPAAEGKFLVGGEIVRLPDEGAVAVVQNP